jgi:hypothetical protein
VEGLPVKEEYRTLRKIDRKKTDQPSLDDDEILSLRKRDFAFLSLSCCGQLVLSEDAHATNEVHVSYEVGVGVELHDYANVNLLLHRMNAGGNVDSCEADAN